MPTKTPPKVTPIKVPPARGGGRKPEPPLVVKSRADVTAAANEFELARQTLVDADRAFQAADHKDANFAALGRAVTDARNVYTAAQAVLQRAHDALADAQAVAK